MAAPPYPTVTTEIAFASLPGSASPTWTDISAYVKSMKVQGAHRQRELNRFEAGTVDLVLDNSYDSGGRFDPNNTAGPYYPNVLPMRRIRVRATWNSVTYDLFNGYVEDWPQNTSYPKVAEVRVKATDAFLALAAIPLEATPFEIELAADTPVAWWPLIDASTGVMADRAGTYDGIYESSPAAGTLNAGSSFAGTRFERGDSARGRYSSYTGGPITAYPFTIVAAFQVDPGIDNDPTSSALRRYIVDSGDDTVNQYGITIRLLDDLGTSLFPANLRGRVGAIIASAGQNRVVHSEQNVEDGNPHLVHMVAASSSSLLLYVDGYLSQTVDVAGTPAAPTTNPFFSIGNVGRPSATFRGGLAGSIAHVVVYNSALSAGRVAAQHNAFRTAWKGDLTGARITRILDAAGWPAGDRDIDAGQTTLQAASNFGDALSALQAVAETESGAVFVKPNGAVKFRDRHALLKSPYTSALYFLTDNNTGLDEIVPDFAVDAIKNDARVARNGGVVQRVQDATSIGKFFRRGYSKTGLMFEKDTEARDHAQWIVNRLKDPPFRYSKIQVTPYGNETAFYPIILAAAIGERFNIQQTPPGSTLVSIDEHMEGVAHSIGPSNRWVADFQLSPVDPTAYFVLGTSTLGGSDVLGY